jgi:hypothetical protein
MTKENSPISEISECLHCAEKWAKYGVENSKLLRANSTLCKSLWILGEVNIAVNKIIKITSNKNIFAEKNSKNRILPKSRNGYCVTFSSLN